VFSQHVGQLLPHAELELIRRHVQVVQLRHKRLDQALVDLALEGLARVWRAVRRFDGSAVDEGGLGRAVLWFLRLRQAFVETHDSLLPSSLFLRKPNRLCWVASGISST